MLQNSILRVLAIDPSINNVGWAYLEITRNEAGEKEMGWNWGVFNLDGWNLLQRCKDLVHYVDQQNLNEFDYLLIEWPMFYSSEKGQVAATESYTINLAAIGAYLAGWYHIPTENVELITAPQWKGNQTKAITARRFMKQFGCDPLKEDHNAIDATMMLLAHAQKAGWLMPDT